MKVLDKTVEKFDAQGQPGVAEDRIQKRVNRKRAAGVIAGAFPALIGAGVLIGGLRHGGLDGAIKEGLEGFTSVLRNSEGELDMPFFDVSGKRIEVIDTSSIGTETSEVSQSIGSVACPTEVVSVELLPGEYVSTATYRVNGLFLADPNVDEFDLDALWINYYSADNNGADPNNPGLQPGDSTNLRILQSIVDCTIQ